MKKLEPLLMEMGQLLWKTVQRFLKKLIIESPFDPANEYKPERTGIQGLNRYLYTHRHSSIVHSSQKVEATPVSTDR